VSQLESIVHWPARIFSYVLCRDFTEAAASIALIENLLFETWERYEIFPTGKIPNEKIFNAGESRYVERYTVVHYGREMVCMNNRNFVDVRITKKKLSYFLI